MPRVWNKYDPRTPKAAKYVGRTPQYRAHLNHCRQCASRPLSLCSVGLKLLGLGNPFELERDGDRAEVMIKFVKYCTERMAKDFEYHQAIRDLKGQDLVCWCMPLACHATIYLNIANEDLECTNLRSGD